MATYGYRAITKAGKEVKGSLEADNKDLAMAELRRQELTVIDLGEQSFLTKDIDIQIGGWPKAQGSQRHVPPVRQHDQSWRQHPRIPENALRTDREQEITGCTEGSPHQRGKKVRPWQTPWQSIRKYSRGSW